MLIGKKASFLSMFGGRSASRDDASQTMHSVEETRPSGSGETHMQTTLLARDSHGENARESTPNNNSVRNAIGAGSPLAQRAWQPEQQDIRRERLHLVHDVAQTGLISAFLAALAFFALSWNTPRFETMSLWFGGALVTFAIRAYFLWRSHQYVKHREADIAKWEIEQTVGAFLGGLVWASMFIFVPPTTQLTTFLYFAALVVILLVPVPMLSALMSAFWAFIIPCAVGGIYLLTTSPYTQLPILWALALILVAMVYVSLKAYRRLINENVKYRLMNARLTAEMMVTLEDPTAGVLRVLQGEVRYANERMSELTGLPVDRVMRSPLSLLMGPGPWSDPNWTQLKQALAHGLPQTFNWWLPNAQGTHVPVRVRTRGVWDFSQSHGGVMLFSRLSPAPLYSTSAASESLPILLNSPEDWLAYARIDRRKRSANPVMVVVIRPSAATDFAAWRALHEGQLYRRLSAREMICFNETAGLPCVYLWLSASVRDLTVDQVRASLLTSLTDGASAQAVIAPGEVAQLELSDGAELVRLRHAASLQVGVARVDHDVEPELALERALLEGQPNRDPRSGRNRPMDNQPYKARL